MKVNGRCHCGNISYEAEVDPDTRTSSAWAVRTIYYLPYRASARLEYRWYEDTWGVHAWNIEAGYVQPLPYNLTNARLLHRAIFWAAGKESQLRKWFCDNPATDCAFYPKSGQVAVVNHSGQPQATRLFDAQGRSRRVTLKPYQSRWLRA